MTPSVKLNSYSFGVATAIVFTLWMKLGHLVEDRETLKIVLGVAVSLGVYRLIAYVIVSSTIKIDWIKKYFLGEYYLEGTWVGFYYGSSGKVRFIVERFEQDMEKLVIRGKSFNEESKYHSTWTSSSVNIDPINGRITYMYDCFPINDRSNNNGIAIFNFDRKTQYKGPDKIWGFSTDLHIGKRIKAIEKRASGLEISETEALAQAKQFYEENKDAL